jgi:hypothetical protein
MQIENQQGHRYREDSVAESRQPLDAMAGD